MAGKTPAEVDVKKMTKTERTELRRIVKRRFRMLREQLSRRERELQIALEKQMKEERASAVAKIEKRLKPLIERQNKLAAAYREVYEEASALGVRIALATTQELDPARHAGVYGPGVTADVRKDVHDRLDEIKEGAGWTRLNLNEFEWQLDEQLAVGELETESASEFLAGLPTVESLLPLPAGVELPAIEPGEVY